MESGLIEGGDDVETAARRLSSRRTFSDEFDEVPVSRKLSFVMRNKTRVFFMQVFPMMLAVIADNVYLDYLCQEVYTNKEEDLAWQNSACPGSLGAEFTRVLGFSVFCYSAFYIRKELLLKRERLLSSATTGVCVGKIGWLLHGIRENDIIHFTPDEFGDLIVGRLPSHRVWELRGPVILPAILSLFVSVLGAYNNWINGLKSSVYMVIKFTLFFILTFSATNILMVVFLPFTLMCIVVAYSSRDRMGLWNQSDMAVWEMQRVSMHLSISLAISGTTMIIVSIAYQEYFLISLQSFIASASFLFVILVVVIVLPIAPIISTLRMMKEQVLCDVFVLMERANQDYLVKLKIGEHTQYAKENVDRLVVFHKQIVDVSVVPSSVEVIRTTIFGLVVITLPIALNVLSQAI